MYPVALTIAGSDPSGGAGIQADLKTFHQLGVYGASAITLITVQNTLRVSRVSILDPVLVAEQIRAVLEDIPPGAAKTGALGSAGVIEAVAAVLAGQRFPLVVDPVMISKHGAPLMDDNARETLCSRLLPLATLVTPNLPEAAVLAGIPVNSLPLMREAALRISQFGPRAVLVKGGHLENDGPHENDAVDLLYADGVFTELRAPRIATRHTHGTGCAYSAAITALLAGGAPMLTAVRGGKAFISEAIRTAPGLGGGSGPVNHHAKIPDSL